MDSELAVSRIYRNGEYILAADDEILQSGDTIYGVSAQSMIDSLELKIGKVVVAEKNEIEGPLAAINILVTKSNIVGKTIEQVGIYRRYPANITCILRNGMKILPTLNTTLELGDTVKVVGKKEILKDVRKELGDSVKELARPNISSIFLGIFLGIMVGCIPCREPELLYDAGSQFIHERTWDHSFSFMCRTSFRKSVC